MTAAASPDALPARDTMPRRRFFAGAAAIGVASSLPRCAPSEGNYAAAVRRVWRPFARSEGTRAELQTEFVRYATLAPSSHNTQCWTFELASSAITVRPDFSRRCHVVDPDDHHLFVSLGCAIENLVQAALAHGFYGDVAFDRADGGAIRIALSPVRAKRTRLYDAIPFRRCARTAYDARPCSSADLRELASAGRSDGVAVRLFVQPAQIPRISTYVLQANVLQTDDPAFRAELLQWLRFNEDDAAATGDGLLTSASGNPTSPRWLASTLYRAFYTARSENAKLAPILASSSGIAVFSADVADPQHWVEVGRCYERFALQATALGIETAMINQAVEVPSVRRRFAAAIGIGHRRPDLVVRFGFGPTLPRSLRRPVRDVIRAS